MQNNIDALIKRTDLDYKIKNLNKKIVSNKSKLADTEKKTNDLTNPFAQTSEKDFDFLSGRMYVTGNHLLSENSSF